MIIHLRDEWEEFMNSPFISNLFDFWITPILVIIWKITAIGIINMYEGRDWWTSIEIGVTQGNIDVV